MKYLKLIQVLYKPLSPLFFIIGFSSLVCGENKTSTLLPSDGDSFSTIQVAIDAALDGDRDIVHPGTYVENFERLTPEEIISAFSLRMVEIDSKGSVALGYPKFDEIEVSLPKYKISGETVTFGIWSKVRQAAERKLGWELAEGLQGSGYDDTNENHPVTKIGFLDVTLWCNALSKMAGLEPCYSVEDANGKIQVFEPNMLTDAQERGVHFNQTADGIRIPTGNEWEVAGRGGLVGKKYPWGNEYPGSTRANWYVGNGMPNSTTEVGSYPENGYGLFDMAGGVWEMTWDDALQPDVENPAVLSDRYINRGGAWNAGWSPEVSTNGSSIRFDDRRHEIGFRVATNGVSMGKAPPPIGPPTGTPEPLVDYIKLLREIMEEIARVESELNDLSEQTIQKDAEIEKLESELVSINREINEARVQLADCLEDCNRTREEMDQVQKETLTHNLTIVGLEGELRASAERLNSLRNDRDGMVKQITKIEKDMEKATAKLNTAHTPGWHYVPAYGWLWTSPEHYPLIYSSDREGWVYYERGTSDPWLYFDYNSEKWEQWFHDSPLFSSNN
ncbi:SUMF1/EgtB/PvdO family nonheme iron enzyme [Opitutales bacterium]|nr:SUMF1/EgtB/PvdO family nonheme iron enzyme [Opitutales bacterium]